MCLKECAIKHDTNNTSYALQGSFVEDMDTNNLKDREWQDMAFNWIGIKNDSDVMDEEIDKAMEEMKADF